MMLQVFKSKIHRATVTQAELHYEGSITIDKALIKAANMVVGERVQIVNVNNGERLETYIIEGEENSGVICLNGPAARRVSVGDTIIIISYAWISQEDVATWATTTVHPIAPSNTLV